MKFTQVPTNLVETLQLNAGIMVDGFTPATGAIGNIIGATTGGFTFNSNPTYVDFGEDVDNMPPNTKQMKRISYYDPTISGTFLTISKDNTKRLNGAGAFDTTDTSKFIPGDTLTDDDFEDIWVIGDFSDKNSGSGAGYYAVHLMNALNTAGIQWATTKDGKGQFSFEFHGHYDYEDIETAPFEIYVKAGTA